jgi:hypothetical protein
MYKMNEGWTDERMDDFRDEVHRRFDEVDRRFTKFEGDVDRRFEGVDRRFEGVDRRFDEVISELHRINDRLDGMYRASYLIGGGIIAALLGVVVQL